MSRFTKRKFVEDEVLNKYDLPTENQEIVKVMQCPGNNLHEVCTAEGQKFLVSMPPKFRKHIWVKRGSFVVIDPIVEGVKVKGEIVQVLLKDQIKYFKDQGVWPDGFCEATESQEPKPETLSDANSSDDELFINTNRPPAQYSASESSTDSSDEDDDVKDGK